MVFKASRKTSRKLKTRVSLLILVCLIMPTASEDNDSNVTSVSMSSIAMKHCGLVMLTANVKSNEVYPKSRSSTKDLLTYKKRDIKILKRVRTQLRVARNHFRINRLKIALFYNEVKTVMITDYHYEWLPSQPWIWYEKYIKQNNKDDEVKKLLPVLRDSLHNFSVTLEQMQQVSETHYTTNDKTRKKMLSDLYKHLIAVLCEVETALVSLSWWHDEKVPDVTPQTVIVGGSGWDPNPDHTVMMIQDWGVLTIYYRFLKDWLLISQQIIKDQSQAINRVGTTVTLATTVDTTDVTTTDQSSSQPCIRHRCGSSKRKPRKIPSSVT